MHDAFAYIWEYVVKDEFREEFVVMYGPSGNWVRLFRKADGYLKTELYQDVSRPGKFISIDYWQSMAHRDQFNSEFHEEYQSLDHECEKLTIHEKLVGEFHIHKNLDYPDL